MTQDAPPTPQHRVGTIGGRPSQCHDATTSRSPFSTRSRLTLPPERQPRQPAPTATTSLRSPAPPAPRADVAKPRAGASGCSEDRRRWKPAGPVRWGAQRAKRFVCKKGASAPTGATASSSSAHSGAAPARKQTSGGAAARARPNQRTSAACAYGAAARTSRSMRGCGISWQERQGQRLPNPVPGPSRGP